MQSRVQRWGNSLAVRLPKAAAERMGVSEGSAIELSTHGTEVRIRPVHRYVLSDLLAGIKRGHLHPEVSTGSPRGREAW